MMRILSPGVLTTVQDLGRYGHGLLGVSPSGAADPLSLRIANRVAGNPDNAAALEMTLAGATIAFDAPALVALAGAAMGRCYEPLEMRAGDVLRLGGTPSGARCYLAVAGGIDVPLVLGSASTHLLSGMGGYHGRALHKGDVLLIGARRGGPQRVRPDVLAQLAPRRTLRITGAPLPGAWRVSSDSNRMGIRLQGDAALPATTAHMITEGVPLGAIQTPPGGQPIILFVEQQTTGGYPRIASVIAADVPSLGQLRPRDEVRFEAVSFEAARAALFRQEQLLSELFET
jgi:biotin-dependent carboxylase-like uncharacterized protein